MAYDLLQYCYEDDKKKAKEILLVKSEEFDNKNCFEVVQNDFEITGSEKKNSKKFIAHECFHSVVTYKWHDEIYNLSYSEYLIYLFFCSIFSPLLLILYMPFHVSNLQTWFIVCEAIFYSI